MTKNDEKLLFYSFNNILWIIGKSY